MASSLKVKKLHFTHNRLIMILRDTYYKLHTVIFMLQPVRSMYVHITYNITKTK